MSKNDVMELAIKAAGLDNAGSSDADESRKAELTIKRVSVGVASLAVRKFGVHMANIYALMAEDGLDITDENEVASWMNSYNMHFTPSGVGLVIDSGGKARGWAINGVGLHSAAHKEVPPLALRCQLKGYGLGADVMPTWAGRGTKDVGSTTKENVAREVHGGIGNVNADPVDIDVPAGCYIVAAQPSGGKSGFLKWLERTHGVKRFKTEERDAVVQGLTESLMGALSLSEALGAHMMPGSNSAFDSGQHTLRELPGATMMTGLSGGFGELVTFLNTWAVFNGARVFVVASLAGVREEDAHDLLTAFAGWSNGVFLPQFHSKAEAEKPTLFYASFDPERRVYELSSAPAEGVETVPEKGVVSAVSEEVIELISSAINPIM